MLRATGFRDGKPIVLLGLEEENLRRLKSGNPIRVNLKRLDPKGPVTDLPDVDVVIFINDAKTEAILRQAYKG